MIKKILAGLTNNHETDGAEIPKTITSKPESFREKVGAELDKLLQESFERLGYGKWKIVIVHIKRS